MDQGSLLRPIMSGLSQQVPMQTLGLAGPAPSQGNPRGGMPGGVDPAAGMFDEAQKCLKTLADILKREGKPKSLQMANKLSSFAVQIDSMAIQRAQEMQQDAANQPVGGNFPAINAGGVLG